MTVCKSCGQTISLSHRILTFINRKKGPVSVRDIVAEHSDVTPREVHNTLTSLARSERVKHIRLGVYGKVKP